jgi:hypothetical protein
LPEELHTKCQICKREIPDEGLYYTHPVHGIVCEYCPEFEDGGVKIMDPEDFEPPEMTDKEKIQSLPCMVCGRYEVDAHHIPSRGAGGQDKLTDMVPLCRVHHQQIHKVGIMTMARRHEEIMSWLKKNHPEVILKNLL